MALGLQIANSGGTIVRTVGYNTLKKNNKMTLSGASATPTIKSFFKAQARPEGAKEKNPSLDVARNGRKRKRDATEIGSEEPPPSQKTKV